MTSPLRSSEHKAKLKSTVPNDLAFERLHWPMPDHVAFGRGMDDLFLPAKSVQFEAIETDTDRLASDESWNETFAEAFDEDLMLLFRKS